LNWPRLYCGGCLTSAALHEMNSPSEFYIGWEAKAAPGIGRTSRRAIAFLFLLALSSAAILACAQRLIGTSVFEWGKTKTFAGILKVEPYPHLLVPRPGQSADLPSFSSYYLVAPWKFGLPKDKLAGFDSKPVSLKGTLIYRESQTMIEVQPDSIRIPSTNGFSAELSAQIINHKSELINSTVTLRGEIVDSKCFLGVMNPGRLIPHRACAIRCISGGVPPILLVQHKDGPSAMYLLVSDDGSPVNKQVLDMVAEPVEITGELVQQGSLKILRANPSTYQRLKK
jgi:hypothetical protein